MQEDFLCPETPCCSLDKLISQYIGTNYDQSSDTSLFFLPGSHYLEHDLNIGGWFQTLEVAGHTDDCSEPYGVKLFCRNHIVETIFHHNVTLRCLHLENCFITVWNVHNVEIRQSLFHGVLLKLNDVKESTIIADSYVGQAGNGSSRITIRQLKSKVEFRNNTFATNSQTTYSAKGVLEFHSASNIHIINCTFIDNSNTAILAIDSTFILEGIVAFMNNAAYEGGAIAMYDSYMNVTEGTHLYFEGNHADNVGGAIFSSTNTISKYIYSGVTSLSQCVLTFFDVFNASAVSIQFVNNTADNGGSAVYGITLSRIFCNRFQTSRLPTSWSDIPESQIDWLSGIVSFFPDNISSVSNDPLRVCICPGSLDCLAISPPGRPSLQFTVYPGQTFTLHTAVVGFNFGISSGSVYAQFFDSNAVFGSNLQSVQQSSAFGCTKLQYSVLSDRKQEILILTADGRKVTHSYIDAEFSQTMLSDIHFQNDKDHHFGGVNSKNPETYYKNNIFYTNLTDSLFWLSGLVVNSLQSAPVFVSVTLLDCPPGFALSGNPAHCICDPVLQNSNVTCNINTQTIRRFKTTWLNSSFNSSGVIVHHHCPFDYCRPEAVDVNLTEPDSQCAFNHSGTLCGACKPGLSLALGSAKCKQCSNQHTFLLIVFAVAGFALVFFINVLNLTVSKGTINGLIFYANIVGSTRSVFFPAELSKSLVFLSAFISWLNLDLGIETCFFRGLDGYWKTWLQFVFPFYVWTIEGLIILLCRHSTRATKLFGKSSVSVLATLFLLSYTKLLRTIIAVFTFTYIDHPNGSRITVWAFDANLLYFGAKHSVLFVFALLVMCLPYTPALLFAKCLRRHTHRKGLRWLKPFFDAYFGPLNDKQYYWVGLMLLVRAVLFIFFASFFAIEINLTLFLISLISFALVTHCAVFGKAYIKSYVSYLENLFILNLGVLSVATLYIKLTNGNQGILVTISTGAAFLKFVGIISFHSYVSLILPALRKFKNKSLSISADNCDPTGTLRNSDMEPSYMEQQNTVTCSTISLDELRNEKVTHSGCSVHGDNAAEIDTHTSSDPMKFQATNDSSQLSTLGIRNKASQIINCSNFQDMQILNRHAPDTTLPQAGARLDDASIDCGPPRYFAAKREGTITPTELREPLLEYMD